MNKSRTPQIFFVLAALTLAAGTGATIFQWQEIGDKWDSLAELKKNVRDPEDIQTEFDDTSRKVTASKAELDHLERGIPAFAYVPTMLKELEAFGKQNGIEVLGIRPIPKVETKDKDGRRKKAAYEEIAIEVKGRGQFKAVQSFVTALAKFPKIVSARAVSLQPRDVPGQAPGTRTLDATIELRAFLFPPQEGDVRMPAPTTSVTTTPVMQPGSEAPNADSGATTTPAKSEATAASTSEKPKATASASTHRVKPGLVASRKSAQRRARR